jgi:tRNA A37 threonylcarbamoyladenosine synthetase subunit TsaC/SUA5/YrdC
VPLILQVDPENPDPAVIREAAEMIREGLVVAYPTDTLYGLAVDPRNAAAVRRLYDLKGRSEDSALTLIAADMGHARAAGDFTAPAERLAARWWPGPLTIVIRARAILTRAILDAGAARGGAPSTIVDACARDVTLIRAGAAPWERVLKSLE